MAISTKQIRPMDALHMVARTQDVRDGFALIDRIAALEDVVRELVDGGRLLKVTSMVGAENGLAWIRWEHLEKLALALVNQGGK